MLGDGRGVALVGADGSVDWWATPSLDSPPAFAGILDPGAGGAVTLRPDDPRARSRQRYLPDTNVLETTWTTDTGTVVVTDCLNTGQTGVLPWGELGRRMDGIDGSIEMELQVRPGDGLRAWQPWTEDAPGGPVLHAGALSLGVRRSDGIPLVVEPHRVHARFPVAAGERRVVGIVSADADPLFLCDAAAIDRRIDRSIAGWRDWASQVQWEGADRDALVRSALALKLLMINGTGAVAAAATTSLPERIGGPKNWDYRFAWVRDAALTIDALADLGLQEEVHAATTWLLNAIRSNGPDLHVMYTLTGQVPEHVRHPDVPGYRASRPVMIGNTASTQTQLGIYGHLFGTVAGWVERGHVLDLRSRRELADLADACADSWLHDDAGIWELHTNRPYTSSKMSCWRALDAAARLAETGHLDGTGHRWRSEADRIAAWVREHCWSDRRQAYTFYAGTDDLDASVLLGAMDGFDTGPRMSSTIDAVSAELGSGALLYRYSGVDAEEQTFLACAFWRVHALVLVGRREEAERLIGRLSGAANSLGLMSEMLAPTGEHVGNLPQALSHLAHIGALTAVLSETDPRGGRAGR